MLDPVKVSQMPAASALDGTELEMIIQDGVNKKSPKLAMLAYINAQAQLAGIAQVTNLQTALDALLAKSNGIAADLSLSADATAPLGATTLQQVQALIASGKIKKFVNLTSDYNLTNADADTVFYNASGSPKFINAPASGINPGLTIYLKSSSAAVANTIRFTPASASTTTNNINGMPYWMCFSGRCAEIRFDSVNYKIANMSTDLFFYPAKSGSVSYVAPEDFNICTPLSNATGCNIKIPVESTTYFPVGFVTYYNITGNGVLTFTADDAGVTFLGQTAFMGVNARVRLEKISATQWQPMQVSEGSPLAYSVSATGIWASAQTVNGRWYAKGRQVTIDLEGVTATTNAIGNIITGSIVPPEFRPSTTARQKTISMQVTVNGVNRGGQAMIRTDGSIQIFQLDSTGATTNFPNSGTCGFQSFSITFLAY